MSKTATTSLLSLSFIIIGALVWKYVFKREFTWESAMSPPLLLILIPVILLTAAVAMMIGKKSPPSGG
jgi:hypothetical protein